MGISPQELAARLGRRIRQQDNQAGRPTTQEQAQRVAADLLNRSDNKKK